MSRIPPAYYAVGDQQIPRVNIDAGSAEHLQFMKTIARLTKGHERVIVALGKQILGSYSRYRAIGLGSPNEPVALDVAIFESPHLRHNPLGTVCVATLEHVPVSVHTANGSYVAQISERRISAATGGILPLKDYQIPGTLALESTRFLEHRLASSARGVGYGILHGLRIHHPTSSPLGLGRLAANETEVARQVIDQLPPPNPAIMNGMLYQWAGWHEPTPSPGLLDWLVVSSPTKELVPTDWGNCQVP